MTDGRCSVCGSWAGRASPGPCDACCAEFQLSRALHRPALMGLERSMRYGMRVTAICYALLGLILCVWSLASWTYGGALPAALSATLRLAQFAVTLLAIWLSLRLDAAVRELPSIRVNRGEIRHALARLETQVPGAALATLAMFAPWSIGVWRSSAPLMLLYLLLASLTATAAAMLWLRLGAYQRFIDTCSADASDRAPRWANARPGRRATAAFGFWLLAILVVPQLPWLGVGRGFSPMLEGGLEQWIGRTAWSALYVAEVLWLAAFIDAWRHLVRWLRD